MLPASTVWHSCRAGNDNLDPVNVSGKVVIVTGAANGIGLALARRFEAEGARAVVSADLANGFDVSKEADIRRLVAATEAQHGQIDLFCSNAGILIEGGVDTPDDDWDRIWDVNVKAHIYAARAVLPGMIARGSGYLLQTVSAAGLLTQPGSAPYAVTKHASLALAEWLSMTHYDQGIRVSALCPQGVRTNMLGEPTTGIGAKLLETAITPEQVADAVIAGINAERFLILPHPEVAEYFQRKANDYDRWLRGMRRLGASLHQ
jgi:NAD(P)-dependent dehydrogenase (short-subunit alcohol dehydrogenase family)